MGRKNCYVVETFHKSFNDWEHSEHFDDFCLACEYAYEILQDKVSERFPMVDYEEFCAAMENGQNWVIDNDVIGISDITPSEPEYEDFVLLLGKGGICDNPSFLSGLSYPFKCMGELESVMNRFMVSYQVMARNEFAKKINNGELVVGNGFDYLLYVRIGL